MEVIHGKRRAIFIDENGERIYIDGIELHRELVELLFEIHEELKQEFVESGMKDKIDFLV